MLVINLEGYAGLESVYPRYHVDDAMSHKVKWQNLFDKWMKIQKNISQTRPSGHRPLKQH